MRNTRSEMIVLIEADRDGKLIEYRYLNSPVWLSMESPQYFNFADCFYRIKPEPPKPREWRVCLDGVREGEAEIFVPFDGVAVHDTCPKCIIVREVLEESEANLCLTHRKGLTARSNPKMFDKCLVKQRIKK